MNTDASTSTNTAAATLTRGMRRLAAAGLLAAVGSGAIAGVVAAEEHIAVMGDPIIGVLDDDPIEMQGQVDELEAYLTPRAATKVEPKLPKPTIAPNPQMTIPSPPKPVLTPNPEMTIPWPVPGSQNNPEEVAPEDPATPPPGPDGAAAEPQGSGDQPSGPIDPAAGQGGFPGAGQTSRSTTSARADGTANTVPGSTSAGNEISSEGAEQAAADRAKAGHDEELALGDASPSGSVPFLAAGFIAVGGLLAGGALGLVGRRRNAPTTSDAQEG